MFEAWCFVFFAGGTGSGAMIAVLSAAAAAGAASTTFDDSPAAEADALADADAGMAAPALTAAVGGPDGAFTAAGLPLGGAAAMEGADAALEGAAVVAGAIEAAAAGATDGTASARTLVTMARAATGIFSGSLGRSMREITTPAPAVAPIAVATKTTRAVRAKLGAGAK